MKRNPMILPIIMEI
ncbi:MAG: hypothetical protein ACLUE8_07205 [Lachnospiraceae bacterium]